MRKIKTIEMPRNLRAEIARCEISIRRDDKQKLRQPLKKKMTPDAYTSWILRQKSE